MAVGGTRKVRQATRQLCIHSRKGPNAGGVYDERKISTNLVTYESYVELYTNRSSHKTCKF